MTLLRRAHPSLKQLWLQEVEKVPGLTVLPWVLPPCHGGLVDPGAAALNGIPWSTVPWLLQSFYTHVSPSSNLRQVTLPHWASVLPTVKWR